LQEETFLCVIRFASKKTDNSFTTQSLLKSKYWKVVKGLPVFLHSALVYSREKILPWKVNLGRDPGAEEQILEGSKRVACFFTFCFGIFSRKGVNMEG